MNFCRTVLSSVVLVLIGCASQPNRQARLPDVVKPPTFAEQARRDQLLGRWSGETLTVGGGKRKWLVERSNDGTYQIQFQQTLPNGQVQANHEVGFWGVSGPVYFTITKGWVEAGVFQPADPSDATLYDAYEVLEIDAQTFRYRNLSTGSEFTVRRVGAEFVFP